MTANGAGREYHVAPDGDDGNEGRAGAPLATVSAAAERARPGDTVTVHGGTYRERVDPPRGGAGPDGRIVYRAAEGTRPEIRGSEVVEGWERTGGWWERTLPGAFFGTYNPYDDPIRGDWFDDLGRPHHTGMVYLDGAALPEAADRDALAESDADSRLWHADVRDGETTIRARFGGADPRGRTVEINVRPAVFYPSEPGRDYLAVRGFGLRHAATQWAPPTTEQVGLLGTHWSRGWVIEDNVVSDARCTGITLGTYGRSVDDTGASAERYVETIRAARERGWERGSVGGHVVRNNLVHDCGQAGIVGSMGAAFSEVVGNHVRDVNVGRPFGGAEIAGIKFHGPVDATIAGNRIHRARRGLWLDWMTQGTRVTRNLIYDNAEDDLFLEVNHGPFVVDTNLLLSGTALRDWSEGGAYVHNLIAGDVVQRPEPDRRTPFHEARSTAIAGLSAIRGGDDRFHNNVFLGGTGLAPYDDADRPVRAAGNVFLDGAGPAGAERDPVVDDGSAAVDLIEDGSDRDDGREDATGAERVRIRLDAGDAWLECGTGDLVTTALLGKASVPGLPFTEPDGSPLRIEADYVGAPRDPADPAPGPFARSTLGNGRVDLTVPPR